MKKSTVGSLGVAALLLAGLIPATPALAADASITGTVTLSGVPVAGTEVGWFDPTTGVSGETVTAADGSYVLAPTDGHPFVLYAGIDHAANGTWLPLGGDDFIGSFVGLDSAGLNKSDYMYQSLVPFTASGVVPIALSQPGSILGKAAGLKNRKVTVESLDGARIKTTKASKTGRFEFTGLVPGRYRLTSFLAQHGYENLSSTAIVVTAGASTRFTPKLTKTGTVTGIVTIAGKPVKGVIVAADLGYENGTATDSKGRYTVKNVPAGTTELYFTGQGSKNFDDYFFRRYQKVAKAVVHKGKTTTFDVKLPRETVFTGSVTPTKGANNFTISLVDKKGVAAVSHYVKVGSKKSVIPFSLPGIRAGNYTVVITDNRKTRYAKTSVTLRYGKTASIGSVRIAKKTVSISGSVTGSAPDYVAFENGYGTGSDGSVTNGKYRITGLVPGTGKLIVSSSYKESDKPYYVATREYTIALKKSTKKNVKPGGPAQGVFTGIFTVNGLKIATNAGLIGPGGFYPNGAYVVKGVVDGFAESDGATTYTLGLQQSGWPKEFIKGAPFWLELPGDSLTIRTKRGTTVDIGTVALEVHR
jgi:hypothetical protein